jgi:RHS repeat-associated protein
MARTAPVPNIPPIPGMNPCTWLAGGGAGGGGGSGKGGKGGDGNAGADGSGQDGNPDDGGKGSGACGQGGKGGCTNCSSGVSAGDPVDVQTGNVFTIPKTDLFLPGAFDLKLLRTYSTARKSVSVGMGWGWSHSLAWSLHEHRRSIVVRAGDGRKVELPSVAVGEEIRNGSWGLVRNKDFYVLRPGNEFLHYFGRVGRTDTYRLRFVSYRKRGHISLQYEGERLARAIDSVGRVVLFEGAANGQIASVSVPNARGERLVFARYSYDSEGNLVVAADADGNLTRYAYDDEHRLKRLEYPNGIVFNFRYDAADRCVETWGAYPDGNDPALAPEAPTELSDGTRAKGIYHCRLDYADSDYSEVIDSVRLRRFFAGPNGHLAKAVDARGGVTTREFDERDRVVSVTDPNAATWQYAYDDLDQVVRETDPEGNTVAIARDGAGRETALVDAEGGVVQVWRDPAGETAGIQVQSGATQQYVIGAYGRITSRIDERGARHLYEYDGHANLIAYTRPSGARDEFSYDYWGRRLSKTNALGQTTSYQYSPSGRVIRIEDTLGRSTHRDYDSMGNLVQQIEPGGAVTSLRYGGLNWLYAVRYPDGSEAYARYNREGWPLYLINEQNERYEFEYDASGLVIAERDFGGHRTTYGYDGMGRVAWFDQGAGKFLIERDKVGHVVAEIAPDEATAQYQFNRRGELVAAKRGGVEFRWQRDPIGEIVSEEFNVEGASYTIETTRDNAGDRVASRTSLGHDLQARRDSQGQVEELRAGAVRPLRIARDVLGSPVRRELSEGAAIVDTFDAGPRLRHRQLLTPNQGASLQPEFVGAAGPGETKQYEYSDADELIHVGAADGTTVNLEYDLRHHLLRRARRELTEEFRADASGNYYEAGVSAPSRSYGAGSALVRHGSTAYDHDVLGRVVAKRQLDETGKTVASTRFEWNGWGLLSAVALANETRIEFDYDAFARRIAKRTIKDGEVVEHHHYVWDLVSMVHDVKLDDSGKPAEIETYLYLDNDDETPLAQKKDARGSASGPKLGSWIYYVGDIKGMPESLIAGDGTVLARYDHSAFGKATLRPGSTTSTPFRAPGQQEDPETGLFYNRYRYYDPEIGSFISPDPIGLDGGLNTYAYGPNPIAWIDPLGWKHNCVVLSSDSDEVQRTQSGFDPLTPALNNQPRAHTEQKFVHKLLAKGKGPDDKSEEHTLLGEYPPCPRCHAAMMRGAKHSGDKINYKWKDKQGKVQTISYEGGTGKPTANGDKAEKLAGAYATEKDLHDDWKFNPNAKPSDDTANDFWGVNPKDGAGNAYTEMKKDKNVHQPKGNAPYWSDDEIAGQQPSSSTDDV